MKRIRAIGFVCLLASAAGAYAEKSPFDLAFGAEITCINLDTVGAMALIHLPGIPLFIGFGADFYHEQSGELELTGTIDYWLYHSSGGYLNLYFGLGLYGAMTLDAEWYAAGLRLPIALQIWPLNNKLLELFLEVAPAWVPFFGNNQFNPYVFQAQIALGARFWFAV